MANSLLVNLTESFYRFLETYLPILGYDDFVIVPNQTDDMLLYQSAENHDSIIIGFQFFDQGDEYFELGSHDMKEYFTLEIRFYARTIKERDNFGHHLKSFLIDQEVLTINDYTDAQNPTVYGVAIFRGPNDSARIRYIPESAFTSAEIKKLMGGIYADVSVIREAIV